MRKIFKLSYYRKYCTDSNQMLHTSKDHKICFISGPETQQTNPRWQRAAMLKNKKEIPQQVYDRYWQILQWLIGAPPLPSPPFLCWIPFLAQPSQFILAWDKHQICCLHTQWLGCQPLRFPEDKNSRWTLATILKKENHDITAMAWQISVKFGTVIHLGPPQLVAWKN